MIKEEFACVPRGRFPIEGKEDLQTRFLVPRKTGAI
jgi:hypothetical protein